MNADTNGTTPLLEWNDLEREIAENKIVTSMFDAGTKVTEQIDKAGTWLLVATVATASFAIANAAQVVPVVGQPGFNVLGAMLCLSTLFGLLAKYYAVRCGITRDVVDATRTSAEQILMYHRPARSEIERQADLWQIELNTAVRLDRIMDEFVKPMPRIVRWRILRNARSIAKTPQAAYYPVISVLHRQVVFTFLQFASFMCFMGLGFVSAFLVARP